MEYGLTDKDSENFVYIIPKQVFVGHLEIPITQLLMGNTIHSKVFASMFWQR